MLERGTDTDMHHLPCLIRIFMYDAVVGLSIRPACHPTPTRLHL